jgi:hypothetical protein
VKLLQRLFLQAVSAGRVHCSASGHVYEDSPTGPVSRVGDFRDADKAGLVKPCPAGVRSVVELNDAGRQALAEALAAKAGAQ